MKTLKEYMYQQCNECPPQCQNDCVECAYVTKITWKARQHEIDSLLEDKELWFSKYHDKRIENEALKKKSVRNQEVETEMTQRIFQLEQQIVVLRTDMHLLLKQREEAYDSWTKSNPVPNRLEQARR